jgi:hypothetical protein
MKAPALGRAASTILRIIFWAGFILVMLPRLLAVGVYRQAPPIESLIPIQRPN